MTKYYRISALLLSTVITITGFCISNILCDKKTSGTVTHELSIAYAAKKSTQKVVQHDPYTSTPCSSCFKIVGYQDSSNTMLVIFRESGDCYEYYDVPSKVYDNFLKADSLGKFFNDNIKGYYDYLKIDGEEKSCLEDVISDYFNSREQVSVGEYLAENYYDDYLEAMEGYDEPYMDAEDWFEANEDYYFDYDSYMDDYYDSLYDY